MICFRLLGPLQVCGPTGEVVEIPGVRRRALLAMLLLNAGQAVPFNLLCGEVWPEGAPKHSTNALQAHITRLRRDLNTNADEGSRRIRKNHLGYTLSLAPGELDLNVFDSLRRTAHEVADHDPHTAADKLRHALALWRGPALADVHEHGSRLYAAAVQVEEHRLLTLEELIDLNLRLDRHERIVGELKALTHEYPLRERFYKQLIVALGKAGRRAEAADVFRRARARMISEFGVEPSRGLSRTVQHILSDEPDRGSGRKKDG